MLRKGKPASFRLLSSRLLCRRPWRGQLTPDTFRLVENNTLVPLLSCVLRSLDTLGECFGFGFTQCRRPTGLIWVRLIWVPLAEFWPQPLPALLDEPAKIAAH